MTYGTQAEAAHGDRPHGWRRWTYSTNHKDIGTMYLIFAIVGGVIGGILSMGIRSELMYPGMQIFGSSDVYNLFVSRSWPHHDPRQSPLGHRPKIPDVVASIDTQWFLH